MGRWDIFFNTALWIETLLLKPVSDLAKQPHLKNSGSLKERATILVIVLVLAVAAVVPEVFPNTHDANYHDCRDIQVSIHILEGVGLSSNLDAI